MNKLLLWLVFSSSAMASIDDGDFEKNGIWRSGLKVVDGNVQAVECRSVSDASLRTVHNNSLKLYMQLRTENPEVVKNGQIKMGFFRVCEGEEHLNKTQNGKECRRSDGALEYTEGYYLQAPGIISVNFLKEYGCKNHSQKVKKLITCVERTGDKGGCANTFEKTITLDNSLLMAPPPEDIRAAREAQNPINLLVNAHNKYVAKEKAETEAYNKSIKGAAGEDIDGQIPKLYYVSEIAVHGKKSDFFTVGCDQKSNNDVKTFNELIEAKTKKLTDYEGFTCESGIKGDYGVVLCKDDNGERKSFIVTNDYKVCLREVTKLKESMEKNKVKIK